MSLEARVNKLVKIKKQRATPLDNIHTAFLAPENFTDMSFWCDAESAEDNRCCFNHYIGLPVKGGRERPIYDYQTEIIETLTKTRSVAILKSTGMGITELMLRWTEWMVLTKGQTAKWIGAEVCILVGPSHEKAREMIDRMKLHLHIYEDSTSKEDRGTKQAFTLNGIKIRCWPSMNIAAARSLPNPKIILVDEACFFSMSDDSVVRDTAERYEAKSSPHVVMWSTPFKPQGFFYDLWEETKNDYTKISLPYTKGLNRIYSEEEIERQKKKGKSFEQEYNLSWGYGSGDIYDMDSLDKSIKKYTLPENFFDYDSILSLDPAYGKKSRFGIVGMYKKDVIAYVSHCQELSMASTSDALKTIRAIISSGHYSNLYIDSAYPDLKAEFYEEISTNSINFRENGQKMLTNASKWVGSNKFRIHPKYKELVRQMRAASKNTRGQLDKKAESLDLVDALNMCFWYMERGSGYAIKV